MRGRRSTREPARSIRKATCINILGLPRHTATQRRQILMPKGPLIDYYDHRQRISACSAEYRIARNESTRAHTTLPTTQACSRRAWTARPTTKQQSHLATDDPRGQACKINSTTAFIPPIARCMYGKKTSSSKKKGTIPPPTHYLRANTCLTVPLLKMSTPRRLRRGSWRPHRRRT